MVRDVINWLRSDLCRLGRRCFLCLRDRSLFDRRRRIVNIYDHVCINLSVKVELHLMAAESLDRLDQCDTPLLDVLAELGLDGIRNVLGRDRSEQLALSGSDFALDAHGLAVQLLFERLSRSKTLSLGSGELRAPSVENLDLLLVRVDRESAGEKIVSSEAVGNVYDSALFTNLGHSLSKNNFQVNCSLYRQGTSRLALTRIFIA